MNSLRILSHGAPLLALVCVVSAAKLQGYSAEGDTGLGITLGQVHGGAGHGGVGGGSVIPAIFVGSGVIPESAFGGVTGGVISGEYSAPSVVVAPIAARGFNVDIAGGFGSIAGPDVTSIDVPPVPNTAYITPRN
ncbi:uncharacterized protein LOC125040515 [Penaeus chinensis]|uniref:uncharacterized protein LOC125040515 n=1 Tax=Penaeus chinensis TaxID=139456 RepID=UPI001FB709E3|nr:uncharacterized protein LOC125040515 [Penaeus chinensis]